MLLKANVVVAATADSGGVPNVSLKSVIAVEPDEGIIRFLELFDGRTSRNLAENPQLSLSVFSVKEYAGYQFIGVAEMLREGDLFQSMLGEWNEKRRKMISHRIQQNVRQGFSRGRSEAELPEPIALINLMVRQVIAL